MGGGGNAATHKMLLPVTKPQTPSEAVLFMLSKQLLILPLVSRVTGSEHSPATALLQARTLKFIYFESNLKPEK